MIGKGLELLGGAWELNRHDAEKSRFDGIRQSDAPIRLEAGLD